MKSATLEFEERQDLLDALNGWKFKSSFNDVWEKIFRPFYKHGHTAEIEEIIEKCGRDNAMELIEKLSEIYHEINNDIYERYF